MEALSPPAYQKQPVADRLHRALRHRIRLLHRSGPEFHVLGSTGNVYTVSLTAVPSCTCPDRISPCKHIFFVLIRVLGVPLDDAALRRRTLRPCFLHRLLSSPSSPDSLASPALRRTFRHLDGGGRSRRRRSRVEDGATCPICLDEIVSRKENDDGEEEDDAASFEACGTCGNVVHEECLRRWRRSRGRRGATCVICRARWRDRRRRTENGEYLNLGEYVCEDSATTCGLVMGDGGGGRSFFE